MKNYISPGRTITATAPYDRTSGQGAKIAGIFGVACVDVLSGKVAEFDTVGVFDLAKATGAAWTEGAAIYWDDSAKNCTTTVGSNLKIGAAILMDSAGTLPASADTVGRVRLNGVF